MILKKIVRALERVERNQAVILSRLAGPETAAAADDKSADSLIQQGIDSILNYQVGKKREEQG